jgi:NAD-dependent dihydropyrimidine dehydrogenase PreA subunit
MIKKPLNYIKLTLQWAILLLIAWVLLRPLWDTAYVSDLEVYCPFGGMQALSTYLVSGTLACTMTTLQIFMGLALIIAAILFSKLFCGYLCPLGTLTEWIGKAGNKFKVRYTLKGFADRVLRILKYIFLFLTFYFTISSSELFCKKYDPYFAATSGFSSDVVMLYALIAIAMLVLGSFFITQAWCKYLCPLSAATNIFSNFILFIGITAIYIVLVLLVHMHISWIWLLAAYTTCGFLSEAFTLRLWFFPLFKVTRNPDTCTLCRKCDKACPMAIKVSESGRVSHIDCHLCCDCIVKCPEKGVLKINRKPLRWLPPVIIVILITAGILFSSKFEVPTISQMWGSEQQMKDAKVVTLQNMKSIKCFGSSMSFAEQMKDVKGVLGVKTFVKHHNVEIFYDPAQTDAETVKKAVFVPSSIFIEHPYANEIGVVSLKILNYFDAYDENLLTELLKQQKGIFGFTTSFGEPIDATIYCDPAKFSPEKLKALIETPEITLTNDGETSVEKLRFKVSSFESRMKKITATEFMEVLIPLFNSEFNGYEKYSEKELTVLEAEIKNFSNTMSEQLSYLVSHVSGDKYVVRVQTKYSGNKTFLCVTYVKGKTTEAAVKKAITAKEFDVMFSDGGKEKFANEFEFGF